MFRYMRTATFLTMIMMIVLGGASLNPLLAAEDPLTTPDQPNPIVSDGSGGSTEAPSRISLDPAPRIDGLKYVAIGPRIFEEEIKPLIDWKTVIWGGWAWPWKDGTRVTRHRRRRCRMRHSSWKPLEPRSGDPNQAGSSRPSGPRGTPIARPSRRRRGF